MPLIFVVSTGRCGSTMLSHILKQHPDVLSLNEFMNTLMNPHRNIAGRVSETFWTVDIDGREFWKSLSHLDCSLAGMVNVGISIPEYIYSSAGRFNAANGIPGICNYVLPLLSDDPDSLYDELSAQIPTWPRRSKADHCRALFAVLSDMTGGRAVVERSGGALFLIPILRQQFPEARYVFLHRDGPDCALSMSRYGIYRLLIMRAAVAEATGVPETASPEELPAVAPEEFTGLIAPPFDRQRFMSYPIPVSIFAYLWSRMISTGISALRELPRNIWTSLRYEDIINTPRVSLTRLAGFLGVPAPPQWLEWACDFIDAERAGSAAAELDSAELASVRTACAPGADALASIESGPTA